MGIGKRIARAGIAALFVASGLVGIAGNASADNDTSVQADGVTNVCTIDWGFTGTTDVSIDWDPENLQWPNTGRLSVGSFDFSISATGDPGNRLCGWSVSNTAFWKDGIVGGTQLMPAIGLKQAGSTWAGSGNWGVPGGEQIQLTAPGLGVSNPGNQRNSSYGAEIDLTTISGPALAAPAGTYISVVTLTQTVGAP